MFEYFLETLDEQVYGEAHGEGARSFIAVPSQTLYSTQLP